MRDEVGGGGLPIEHEVYIIGNLLVAGMLTFILGIIALALLRRAILRNMMAVGARSVLDPSTRTEQPRRAAAVPLDLLIDHAALEGSHPGPTNRILSEMVVVHALAGLVFGVVGTLLLIPMSGMEFLPLRTMTIVWSLAWPTVVVLGLIVGPDRPAQGLIVLGYFAGLLALCTLAWLTGTRPLPLFGVTVPGFFQPGVFWAVISSPTIFLLLFLNRAVRTVGPLVLAFAFVALLGGHLAIASLAFEPVFDLAADLAVLSGIHGGVLFWVIIGIGTLAGLWPAWRVVTMLRDRYAAKRSSDLLMTTNAIWLMQALSLAQTFRYEKGGLAALAAIVPFLCWRLTLHAGLRPVVAAAHARTPRRLLLLRVFGFGRRSRRLLDLLGTRWRLIGSIDLIAAPDLAARTVEPSTFIEFVRGRLGRLFIRTPEDLEQRLAAIDREPDPDGRYRVNQLFCSDSMWQAAVTRLMGGASLVVMDLRGFGPHRRGSVFELQTLLDIVPVDRLIFLFDKTTDRAALETLLAERWQKLDAGSPNFAATNATLRLLEVRGNERDEVRRLLEIAEAQPRDQSTARTPA